MLRYVQKFDKMFAAVDRDVFSCVCVEINLLDTRRSLNVNVFLRQFRLKSHTELVQMLARGDSEALGAERLRCLQRVLPHDAERQLLSSFDGDVNRLGNAEKFCLALVKLPK